VRSRADFSAQRRARDNAQIKIKTAASEAGSQVTCAARILIGSAAVCFDANCRRLETDKIRSVNDGGQQALPAVKEPTLSSRINSKRHILKLNEHDANTRFP